MFTNAGARATKVNQLTDKLEPFGTSLLSLMNSLLTIRYQIREGIHRPNDVCHGLKAKVPSLFYDVVTIVRPKVSQH